MKKLFLAMLAASVMLMACHSNQSNGNLASANGGSTTAKSGDGPIMKFDKDTHDFGKINGGDKVTYEFKFTNSGNSPLIISDAVASCGCTRPEWPKTPIKPGENGAIKVTFNSAGKVGLQDKQITITANTNPAQNMVHLIGEVEMVKK